MRNVVVLAAIAAGFAMALGSRFYSVLFYWWLAMFRPQDWIRLDISALRISLVAGLIVVIGCLFSGQMPRVGGPLTALMVVFFCLELLASAVNGCGGAEWRWVDFLFRAFLVLLFTNRLITNSERYSQIMFVVGVSLCFYAGKAGFFAILQGGASQYGLRNLQGSFSDSNAFAHGTAVLVFFVLAAALNVDQWAGKYGRNSLGEPAGWQKWAGWGLVVLALLSSFNVMSLQSRGSTLALAGGWVMFVAFRPGGMRRLLKVLPVVVVMALVIPLPQGFEDRIASAFAEGDELDQSAASRPHLWGVALTMVADNPMGVGTKCYKSFYSAYDSSGGRYGLGFKAVHSSHFQVLAESGYAGFVVWLLLHLIAGIKLARIRARARHVQLTSTQSRFLETNASCLLCALAVYAVGGAFYSHAYVETIWFIFVLTEVLSRLSKEFVQDTNEQPDPGSGTGKTMSERI